VRKAATEWRGNGWSGRKEEVGRGWAETGAGPISSNKTLSNFYLEFDFLATLEICTRRFRRNFGMGIFPKFF
jgi:hypothetical protein